MALKNLEEAMVERIQRAVAKELRRRRRRAIQTHGPRLTGPARGQHGHRAPH